MDQEGGLHSLSRGKLCDQRRCSTKRQQEDREAQIHRAVLRGVKYKFRTTALKEHATPRCTSPQTTLLESRECSVGNRGGRSAPPVQPVRLKEANLRIKSMRAIQLRKHGQTVRSLQ